MNQATSLAGDYLACTLTCSDHDAALILDMPASRVRHLRDTVTTRQLEDWRRQLATLTHSLCAWTCLLCGRIGPYSPGLDHYWAHYQHQHHTRPPSPAECLTCIDIRHLQAAGEIRERIAERVGITVHSLSDHIRKHHTFGAE